MNKYVRKMLPQMFVAEVKTAGPMDSLIADDKTFVVTTTRLRRP